MNLKEFVAAFIIGVGVIWIVNLLMSRFTSLFFQIPSIPIIERVGFVGGLAAVLLIWLIKEKKIGFLPISI